MSIRHTAFWVVASQGAPAAGALTNYYYDRMNQGMTIFLRQSTASQDVMIGGFIDDTDFKTPETGLTIANTDIKLLKDGGVSVNKNSGGGTHRVNGQYSITFDATDTNTVGELEASIVVAGALPVWTKFQVLEEAVYDLFYPAAATGDVKLQGITHTSAVIPNVTLVATTTTNSDMRGTDSAATAANLAALNDFNPASDDVAVVTLVNTTTVNTDMRGTDSANTVVPDAAGTVPTASEINAELVDVLEVDTHTEPTGVVGATATIKDAIMWLKTLGRNKMTQTATTTLLRNDADTLTISTSTVSDDTTTFTKGKHS